MSESATFAAAWAKGITPEEWRDRISRLDPPLCYGVARVVFWDMFAHRAVAERWPHLDAFLLDGRGRWRNDAVDDLDLFDGLIAVGYPQSAAAYRVRAKRGDKRR